MNNFKFYLEKVQEMNEGLFDRPVYDTFKSYVPGRRSNHTAMDSTIRAFNTIDKMETTMRKAKTPLGQEFESALINAGYTDGRSQFDVLNNEIMPGEDIRAFDGNIDQICEYFNINKIKRAIAKINKLNKK